MASQKREQLLTTAELLFYEEGFHATGIDRIVAAAGVVRMTLYKHFPSKNALVAAVLRQRHERFLAAIDAALAASKPGEATLALADAHGAWLRMHGRRGCFLLKAMGEFAEHSAEIYDHALAAKQDLRDRISAALTKDGLTHAAGLERRLFLVLEGCNVAVPTIGADAAIRDTRLTIEDMFSAATTEAP